MASTILSGFPSGLSLLGGVPVKHQDLVASVVFAAAYAAVLPVCIWRLANPESRCFALIRPLVFILVRIGTFIVRAIQSDGHYGKALFIVEQILLLCGFVLLCEPLITLLECHVTRYTPVSRKKDIFAGVLRLLRIALIVALGLGVYAGTKFGDINSNSSQDTINTLKDTRNANAIICLAITALAGIITLVAHVKEKLPVAPTGLLFLTSVVLTIVSIYKLYLYEQNHPPSPIHTGTKVAFYCFVSLPEILATILFLSTNLNTTFDIAENSRKRKAQEHDGPRDGRGDYLMQPQRGYNQNGSYA